MSDPEAGECELPENPQPEDEAQLSTFTAPAAQTPPTSSHTSPHHSDSADREDGNQPQHVATGAAHEQGEDRDDKGEVTEGQGDGEQGGERTVSHQAWPPESDRAGDGCQEGEVSREATEEDAEAANTDSVCEGERGGDVDQGEGSAAMQQPALSGGLPCVVSSYQWDQEESPPEEDRFSALSDPDCQQGAAGGQSAAGDSDQGNSCTQSDLSPPPPSLSAENAGPLPAGSALSSPVLPPAQAGTVPTVATAEKEDDQVPECDRESLKHSSTLASCEAVSSDQAQCCEPVGSAQVRDSPSVQSADSKDDTVGSADSADDSSSPSQSSSQSSPDSVHRPAAEACDNSSDCDSAVSQHSSMSTQLQLHGSQGADAQVSSSQDRHRQGQPYFMEEDSEEEELLTELDAELHLRCSPQQQQRHSAGSAVRLSLNGLKDVEMNSELCKQFEEQLLHLQETVLQKEREISKLKHEKSRQRDVSQEVIAERDRLRADLTALKEKNPDDLYLPQIKELEYTISQQQGEVRQLKEKLTTHDAAAKRAIATLQSEMKARIDQITKLYEDSCREKDSMVVKFAQAETKNIEAKCAEEKMEARVRDLLKEKEFTNNKMRAAMAEKQKAVGDLKTKMGEMVVLQKEMEKVKEEMSSSDYRIKWHQNKLKAELDAHKETKVNLEKMTAKLKEAKEETEMIRKDCQAIVKTYQESEEVRSNSLDKELKMKKTELMIKMKEHSDTEEIHLKTKQELDVLKAHHKDALEELKTLKDKVQCLEEERLQGEQVQARYQTIIQNQKSDNTALTKQLSSLQTLQEDFDRAQEVIKSLDSEVSSLKLNNRDLQKDTEGCQARESKMLTLQSELSRTNALLRSENTSLNNQVATLSGEVQKMTMDIQDLETRCRNMSDQLEEECHKRQEETNSLSSQLAVKCKESEDYKQKWEDEIDASKTWKRKHNSNVKDLTRQLQHAKKRLEMLESGGGGGGVGGGGERDVTSMGSRTNSNGSLNSMDNSNQHNAHPPHHNTHHPSHPPPRPPSQEPEFPVIQEQVEVDKQLLIERIVRLQRSLARKNEKLDFVEEHIQQLVTEIKKKNRIIQGYVMREEAGTLASDVMDANKALLARKGGIMASVYSHHQQDGAMTLDLSLQINQKLQAVLEDTLLKNITLKENLDTLGAEIARLSQENRRLQLHLQGLDSQ
ncbi:coiled-coil domain-containing protein 186-like isoform X2 [Babylonia areolata]|uniref:coiled-coil domain-containing protein 186-like isoform X2 n=1 Tax=Babylonia areolata TaxID=304850 RepID=UPI003FD19B03